MLAAHVHFHELAACGVLRLCDDCGGPVTCICGQHEGRRKEMAPLHKLLLGRSVAEVGTLDSHFPFGFSLEHLQASNVVDPSITPSQSPDFEVFPTFRDRRTAIRLGNNYEHGIVAHLGKYELDHCTITNNGKITNCSIGHNPIAIQSKLYATHLEMTGCNIVQNRHRIVVATKEEFRCRGNYWGTTNAVAIASSISDGYDKRGQGCVDFTGFVEKPFKDAGAQLEIKKR